MILAVIYDVNYLALKIPFGHFQSRGNLAKQVAADTQHPLNLSNNSAFSASSAVE
jgi:hypothetical protein